MGMMMEPDAIKSPMYVTKASGAGAPKPKSTKPSSKFTVEAFDSGGDGGYVRATVALGLGSGLRSGLGLRLRSGLVRVSVRVRVRMQGWCVQL